MSRVICVLIGYLFGNFLTAEVVSRHISRESAFGRGTGNPGMANMVHEYGVKNGALISHYLPIGAVLIPLVFLLPAFRFYGNEAGILTLIMALLMQPRQRRMSVYYFSHYSELPEEE